MKGVDVDPARRRARAEAGLRLGELDRETQAVGLATPLGIVTNTGIAGLTLGGGIGWLNGLHGLACDNVLSVELVTADSRVLTASADENEDLFWGIRGGGGNFGVVTSFEYRLHPIGPVVGGLVLHPIERAEDVLRFYRDFAQSCPDELSTVAALLTGPGGDPMVAVGVCWCGVPDAGERALESLRAVGAPAADLIRPMSYVEMQNLFDESSLPWILLGTKSVAQAGVEYNRHDRRPRERRTTRHRLQQPARRRRGTGPGETRSPPGSMASARNRRSTVRVGRQHPRRSSATTLADLISASVVTTDSWLAAASRQALVARPSSGARRRDSKARLFGCVEQTAVVGDQLVRLDRRAPWRGALRRVFAGGGGPTTAACSSSATVELDERKLGEHPACGGLCLS